MTARILCIVLSAVVLAACFGFGRKLLLGHAFLQSKGQKALKLVIGLVAGFSLFLMVGAFFYLPAEKHLGELPPKAAGEAIPKAVPDLIWMEDLAAAQQAARDSGKPLLVDCWASWCKPCKKLFKNVLTHDSLSGRMGRFVLVKMNTDDEVNEQFVEKYEIGDDLPWVGFFSSDGKLLKEEVLNAESGAEPFSSPEKFAPVLDRVLKKIGGGEESAGWLTDLNEGFKLAKEQNKPLLVDGWAVWCTSCIKLKKETFTDPKVKKELESFVTVALDMDLPENEWVWDTYSIKGLPWVAVFEPGQREKPRWMLPDFEPPDKFAARLTAASVEQDDIASWLKKKGLAFTLLLVFLAGILASLTPCAYPSYLLIFGFFSSPGEEDKTGPATRALLAAAIVLGMGASYSAAGLIAAFGGGAVGRVMTNPYVMGGIAVLFILMGASSLSVLPQMEFQGVKSALHSKGKSNLLWAFVFGLVMGLIVAPCVGPILIGILTYIAAEGDKLLGVLLMSTFALGMGVLFFILAFFSQTVRSRLKMGAWSEFITVLFSVIFFAAAFYYLKGVIPYEGLFALFPG